ncbi:helix-turn-helix domain-containing protein [Microbacterium sp. NPDC055599]
MPRPKKIISDFDVCLGKVVKSKRVKAGLTREALADAAGIADSNLKRREAGENEITVSELERISTAVEVPALEMVEEALKDYGGVEKLVAEFTRTSEPATNVDPADDIPYIGRVVPPQGMAANDDPRTPPKE